MTTRELPPPEWPRLEQTVLKDVWAGFSTDHVRIVVVENDAGDIVGTCAILTFAHLEGLGIDPEHQSRGDVWRRLMHGVGKIAAELRLGAMVAGSSDDRMSNYLSRMGATPLAARFFVLPMSPAFTQKES